MNKQISTALTMASLALALVVLNVAVVKVFAQGTNETLEKGGGLEKLLKQSIAQKAHTMGAAAAGTHRTVLGMFSCPANFTSIERECDIFLIH